MALLLSTGIFIPFEKQSMFILAFEEILYNIYNIVPQFGPATNSNLCEVKFNHVNHYGHKPSSLEWDSKQAKGFLEEHLYLIMNKSKVKKKTVSSSTVTQVIDLDDENRSRKPPFVRMVDLTESEPEIIVLDETMGELEKSLSQLGSNLDRVDIDLTELDETPIDSNVFKAAHSQALSVKKNKKAPSSSRLSKSNVKILDDRSLSHFKRKKKVNGNISDDCCVIKQNINSAGPKFFMKSRLRGTPQTNSVSSVAHTQITGSSAKSKKKLQDVANILPYPCSPLASTSHKSLSDGILKYYADMEKTFNKIKDRRKKSPLKNGVQFNKAKGNKVRKSSLSQMKRNMKMKKKEQGALTQRVLHQFSNDVITHVKPYQSKKNKLSTVGESNIFNPNPYIVDKEGLRPVVVDGSNIAIGHGKGTFSVKGVKICADYFASRGHSDVKVFLPHFRQDSFTKELLADLESKCDVVFTPSLCVNGIRKTPYDDRFIVQYAVEFGGVIVSTDNYRDLLRENPRWRETIEKRLLMFTWVDDFLMFPVDPLGRSGPTLEEFLRF